MKLEPKHIAPYLPYELKMLRNRMDNQQEILTLKAIQIDKDQPIDYDLQLTYDLQFTYDGEDCNWLSDLSVTYQIEGTNRWIKPILRPMSDLYREVDGKIGIVELAKIAFPKKKFEISRSGCWCGAEKFMYDKATNSFITLYEDGGCFSPGSEVIYQLDLFECLFENHYDVYDLIGQNLAIDKNTVK